MINFKIKNSLLLMLTALIWGFAFVPQKLGGSSIGLFSFTCIRFLLGGIILIPLIIFKKRKFSLHIRKIIPKGIICGIILFCGTALQQFGLNSGADAGKGGFITALYIILVPILGLFFGKKLNFLTIISVFIATVGMYFLCINSDMSMGKGEYFIMLASPFFALHILFIESFVSEYDPITLSCVQFFVCGLLALPLMLFFENTTVTSVLSEWKSLLYIGCLSSGIAYTLQSAGQKNMNPTIASLILSLESVFAVIGAMIFLNEIMSQRELFGCILIFISIVLIQLPLKRKKV